MKLLNKLKAHQSGQATVEAVVVSTGLIAFSVLLLVLIYLCVLKTYFQYSSHELLVCREISEPLLCEKEFKKQINSFVRFGKIESFWSRKELQKQSMQLKWTLTLFGRTIHWVYRDEIKVPLIAK